jgi:stress response protein YsnF
MVSKPNVNKEDNFPKRDTVRTAEVRVAAVQEEAEVGVKQVETGAIRVKKIVREEFEPLSMTLHSQNVDVKRVTVGRPVDEKFGERREGGTLIIPVFEYVPVVRMQLTLKEEVHVTTTETSGEVTRDVLTYREEVIVERRRGAGGDWSPARDSQCFPDPQPKE